MHGDLYVESYKRYKSGTKTIFKWLVSASRMCKEHAVLDIPPEDDNTDTFGSNVPRTRSFPLSKYAQLAHAIAASEDKIEVGPRLLSVLKDVISLRKAFNVMHELNSADSSSEDDKKSHDRHRYVISVLEEIWACLQPLCSQAPRQNMTNINNDELPGLPVGNLYGVLDVEDVEEPVFSQTLVKRIVGGEQQEPEPQPRAGKGGKGKKGKGKGKSKTKTKNRFVEDDFTYDATDDGSTSLDEIYFILFCFYKDLNDIREYLRKLWASYGEGDEGESGNPLIAAAVVTDLAIDVVKRKEQELGDFEIHFNGKRTTVGKVLERLKEEQSGACADLFWQPPKSQATIVKGGYVGALLFDHISSARRLQDPNMSQAERDQFVSRRYTLADWLCVPEYIMLETLQTALLQADNPDASDFGDALPATAEVHGSSAGGDFRGRFFKEQEFFTDFCMEFVKLSQVVDAIPELDAWTKPLVEWLKTNVDLMSIENCKKRKKRKQKLRRPAIPVHMIWGSSVFLDIFRVLGPNVGRGYHELKNFGYEMKGTLSKHFEWSARWKDGGWPKSHDRTLRATLKQFENWVFKDVFNDIVGQAMAPVGGGQRPNWLLLHHPLWSGLFLMRHTLTYWNMGIELCNVFMTVFHPSHLYNMARAENKKSVDWKDMEYLLDLHDSEWLFYGGRPSQMKQYYGKWTLAMGMSMSAAQGRSRRGNQQSMVSSRGFEEATRLMRPRILPSQMLCNRYDAMRISYQVGDDAELQALGILLSWQNKAGPGSMVKKESQGSFIVPLLQVAASVLASDYKHYRFDYWDMNRRGWAFLMKLQEDLREHLQLAESISKQDFTSPDSMIIRHVPGHIMNTTTIMAEAGPRPNVNQARLAAAVYKTYDIVDEFTKARGSEGIDLVARRLAGEAPEPVGLPDAGSDGDEDSDVGDDFEGMEDLLAGLRDLPGPRNSGRVDDNDPMLDSMMMMLAMDPTSTITRDEARLALYRMKNTPYERLNPSTRAMFDLLQESGADIANTGLMGAAGTMHNMMADLSFEQQEELLATTDLSQLVDFLKRTR